MEELFLSAAACTVHGINDVRQTEIHTEEPLVPSPVPLSLRWLLKSYIDKSPGNDQIPAD